MEYIKEYTVKDEHIDMQNIMDGLYYPFYMEECRHEFVKDVLGIDIAEEAAKGNNLVLSQYTIKFLRSLKKGDVFTVNCSIYSDKDGGSRFYFMQSIFLNGKVMTQAVFTATCVSSKGGRPFIPENLRQKLQSAPFLEE